MTHTANHTTNENVSRTNPKSKENTMSIRTLITAAGAFALSLALFVSPAKADNYIFGQDPSVTGGGSSRSVRKPELRMVFTAEMIFYEGYRGAAQEPQLVREWDQRLARFRHNHNMQSKYTFGSKMQRHYRRLAEKDRARLQELGAIGRQIHLYKTYKGRSSTVVLRGRYANNGEMQKIIAEFRAGTRTLGHSVYKSD